MATPKCRRCGGRGQVVHVCSQPQCDEEHPETCVSCDGTGVPPLYTAGYRAAMRAVAETLRSRAAISPDSVPAAVLRDVADDCDRRAEAGPGDRDG